MSPSDTPTYGSTYADPNAPATLSGEVTPRHTEAEEEMLNSLYAELKPVAVEQYIGYFLARTPAHLQDDMKDLIKADLAVAPTPPPALLMTKAEQEADAAEVYQKSKAGPGGCC